MEPALDRRERILTGLNLDGLGLEIGPGYNPLAAGDPQLRVKTLDHLDQAGLIEKYAKTAVDTSRIQRWTMSGRDSPIRS